VSAGPLTSRASDRALPFISLRDLMTVASRGGTGHQNPTIPASVRRPWVVRATRMRPAPRPCRGPVLAPLLPCTVARLGPGAAPRGGHGSVFALARQRCSRSHSCCAATRRCFSHSACARASSQCSWCSSASRRSRSASCRQASSSRFWFHHSCAAALAMDNGSTATDSNITRRLNMRDLFDGG
jgi:hypothetical protein